LVSDPLGTNQNIVDAQMESSAYILISFLALILIIGIAGRFASRRHSLPCPVWLRWFVELDNPFTRTNRAAVMAYSATKHALDALSTE